MAQRLLFTDGHKSANLLTSDDPSVWNYFSNAPKTTQQTVYGYVAAVNRAYNLIADTVGYMPFALIDMESKEEIDSSETWENLVGILPYPYDIFRLAVLSYIDSNSVYNLLTKDVLGLKVKRMYNAIPSTIKPYTHPVTQQVEYIERTIGTATERYNLKGKQIQGDTGAHLVYMWWTDHTSEILPSENTIARAIQNSAEEVLYTDNWIKHYFKRGGIRPTLVAMKGLIDPTAKEQKEESWSKWLMQLGRDTWRKVRMYNAEAIDIKPFGDGIGDLKDNKVYEQALANIAMGTGIPLSLLLANSANYATASVEERQWYKSKIAPLCRWLAYNYNEQIFHPMFNQHLIFKTESVDAQQEEESARMDSATKFLDLLMKCPSYEMLEGIANTLGMEISEDLLKAAEKFFTDKEQREKEMQAQMQQGGYVVGADGKPVPVQTKPGEDPKVEPEDDEKKPFPPKKSIKANDNSAMIALRIPDPIRAEIASKYPFVDAETLKDLHITIVYLGDSRTLNKIDVIRAASEFAQFQSPIKGTLQGLARFVNGTERDPLVVTFDSPQMPRLYTGLAGCLDGYHIPYHKEHGFIPHMTLAYIPAEAEMPIDSIEPIEINFSEIYLVDGNEWLPIVLTGYENKTKWTPSLDEIKEISTWHDIALRHLKKAGNLAEFDYLPHHGGLSGGIADVIKTRLAQAKTADDVRAAFVLDEVSVNTTPTPEYKSEIVILAEALNKYTDAVLLEKK
jgi:2'-5' RNA ligase